MILVPGDSSDADSICALKDFLLPLGFSRIVETTAEKHGNQTYLYTNATLDFVTSLVLASTYGIGIAFAAAILFLWQSSIYLFAGYLSPFLTAELLAEISLIGGFLILSSGLSILKIKDFKALNMLPALFVPIVWFIIKAI